MATKVEGWIERTALAALAAWLIWHVIHAFSVAAALAAFQVATLFWAAFTLGSVRARYVFQRILREERERCER